MLLGILLLQAGLLDDLHLSQTSGLNSALETLLAPIVGPLSALLPGWAVMLAGLVVLWLSFHLLDRALPELNLENSRFGRVAHLVYRPLAMFLFGAALTFLTLSVSLSLSLLVPLSTRGYIRREDAIPYIMGANITTFVDTLLATVVLGSSEAFTVVLISMVSVTLISLGVMLLAFTPYERAVLSLVKWTTATNHNPDVFMSIILLIPLSLMVI